MYKEIVWCRHVGFVREADSLVVQLAGSCVELSLFCAVQANVPMQFAKMMSVFFLERVDVPSLC